MGRFASKGGGGKRAGKLSKSTGRGRSARAAYHDAKSNLRFEKRIKSEFGGRTKTGSNVTKAKRKLTTLSNRMTGKGKAAGSGLKKGLSAQAASRRKQAFRSKATKGRASKAEWKAARRADRTDRSTKQMGRGLDRNQKRVIKKQTGKASYSRGFRETPSKTKAPRPGSKTKAQKLRAKIEDRKWSNKDARGIPYKGPKKGTAKQVAAGKKRSAKAKATKAAARKASFKGKATQGRAAKAKYKKAAGKVREWKDMATNPDFSSPSSRKKYASAKGQLTRVTNTLTAKGAAKAKNKKTMGKKLTKSQLRIKAQIRKERMGARPKKKLTGKTAPRKGETAKQYRQRMERSGPKSVQRSLYFKKRDGSRQEKQSGYLRKPGYPGISGGESRETRKSRNRAKTRDTWGDSYGGKRSKAISKSKWRHREKVKKQKAWEKKIKGRKG